MTRIEHVNITVPNINKAVSFIKIVAPDFLVRKDEISSDGIRWVHIGNDNYYIALQATHQDSKPKDKNQTYINFGINHIAFIVSDLETITRKLLEAGYKQGKETPTEKYRKRAYYYDAAGFEWELVEYLSEKPSEKFLYE
ncbi:VOC family protein [Polaribacter sp.]|uniref:VOC family protein n=1 Tax=Polaribacter sp. TaxID=1920175 RepID=UPI003EF4FEE5